MKELIGTTALKYASLFGEKMRGVAEVTLLLGVRAFDVPPGGGKIKTRREIETVSFAATAADLRGTARELLELAAELEEVTTALSGEPVAAEPPPAPEPSVPPAPLAEVAPPPLQDLTRAEYHQLKASGRLYEIYPHATGDYNRDTDTPNRTPAATSGEDHR